MNTNWRQVGEMVGDLGGVDLGALEELHEHGVEDAIKETFPINGVPTDVLQLVSEAKDALMEAVDRVERLATMVVEKLREDQRDETGRRLTDAEMQRRREAEEAEAQQAKWDEQSKHRPASR